MKGNLKFVILLLLLCNSLFAAPDSYWQCMSQDKTNKQWFAKNNHKKAAVNLSFAACKKESASPASCKTSLLNCTGFNQGLSISPTWRCMALDRTAKPWQSVLYAQPLDAALGAKAFCKEHSTVPDTCYVNMVTCRNINAGVSM